MLAKQNRVTKPEDFKHALRRGAKQNLPDFTVAAVKTDTGVTRYGFVVSTKVGNSVQRHRLARLMREVAASALTFGGVDIVVLTRPGAFTSYDSAALRKAVEKAARKALAR